MTDDQVFGERDYENELENTIAKLQEENKKLRQELKQRYDNKHELGRLIDISNKQKLQIEELKKENDKLVRILSEAEDFIEIRLPEYYIQQYKNIKEGIQNE